MSRIYKEKLDKAYKHISKGMDLLTKLGYSFFAIAEKNESFRHWHEISNIKTADGIFKIMSFIYTLFFYPDKIEDKKGYIEFVKNFLDEYLKEIEVMDENNE